MSLNKIVSNNKAADILLERLIGSSINKVTYAITEWTLRIIGPNGPEYTLRAADIELINIGLWRKKVSRLPINIMDTNEPDDVITGAVIFSVVNRWPISKIQLNDQADLLLGFENNIEITVKAKVDLVDWTWQIDDENGTSIIFCDSGELSMGL